MDLKGLLVKLKNVKLEDIKANEERIREDKARKRREMDEQKRYEELKESNLRQLKEREENIKREEEKITKLEVDRKEKEEARAMRLEAKRVAREAKAKEDEIRAKEKLERDKKREEERKIKKEERDRINKESAEINRLCQDWIKLMAHLGLDNEVDETYTLTDIKVEQYGFYCKIRNYAGGTLSKLEADQTVAAIQDNLQCLFITKKTPKTNCLEAKLVTRNTKVKDFVPIKLDPWELYLSNDIASEPIVTSMIEFPHVIITGATGSGKSKLIDILLTNLVSTCNPEEVEIYISQVDKIDQIVYRRTRICKSYVQSVDGTLALTNYLDKIVQERNKILEPYVENNICGQDIKSYNDAVAKGKIKGKKWTTMYLIIDEYSTLMPDGENDKRNKEMKQAIQNNMGHLFQIGRSVGMFIILGLQRGTTDKLPSFCKAMTGNTIAFRVNNKKSSEVAIDCDKAVSLNTREFILKKNDLIYGKSLTITPEIIANYINEFKVNDFSNLIDLSELESEIKNDAENNSGRTKRKTKAERKSEKKKAMEELVDKMQKEEQDEIKDMIKDIESNVAAEKPEEDTSNVINISTKKKEKQKISNKNITNE